MFHPLITGLSTLSDIEVETKLSDISQKYFLTSNSDVKNQMVVVIDIYKAELSKRRSAQLADEYKKRDKNLDDLIKIN